MTYQEFKESLKDIPGLTEEHIKAMFATREQEARVHRLRGQFRLVGQWAYQVTQRAFRPIRLAILKIPARRMRLPALLLVALLWSQWYFASPQVFARFSEKLSEQVNRETAKAYSSYFQPLGAQSGYSDGYGWCRSKNACVFSYTHSFNIPIQKSEEYTHIVLSIEISLWPIVTGVDRRLSFLNAVEWWPNRTVAHWRLSQSQGLNISRTISSGTEEEVFEANPMFRPLILATITAIKNGLVRLQDK